MIDIEIKRSSGVGLAMTLMVAVFVVIGIGLCVWGISLLYQASASQSWPTTEGQIIAATVRKERDDENDRFSYYADVTYHYLAAGAQWRSNNVSFGQYGRDTPDHAESIVARYPVGQLVTVYYHPADPKTAVLEPGVNIGSYIPLLLGLMFIGLPLFYYYWASRSQE